MRSSTTVPSLLYATGFQSTLQQHHGFIRTCQTVRKRSQMVPVNLFQLHKLQYALKALDAVLVTGTHSSTPVLAASDPANFGINK